MWSGTSDTPIPDNIPEDSEVRYHYETGNWYVLESPVLLSGDRINDAGPSTGRTSFDIVVSMSFDSIGRRKFAQVTGDHIGEHLAILLDGRVQSAPVIQDQIVGNAIIQGNFTYEEASYLSNILKAGAFPVGVQIAEERTVGAYARARIHRRRCSRCAHRFGRGSDFHDDLLPLLWDSCYYRTRL